MLDHADSSGFVVRILLRVNSDDHVVINGVPIGDRARLSIGFVVALPDDRLKRGRRVFEASMELKVDSRRAPLFLLLSRALKIVVFFRRE
jgi:hypothetical protein